jgi:plasmid stabilization system protein ParE
MAYVITWTLHAQEELNTVYDYLENNWTSREIVNFSKLLEDKLSVIVNFPFIYAASGQKKSVRRCVVSKQSSLYYQVDVEAKHIIILSFFDNRQAPSKLKIS